MGSKETQYPNVFNRGTNWKLLKDIGILIIPAVLYFIPIEWLDNGHPICLVKNIWGVECFGCGITRAIVSVVQLNFEAAYGYNKLIIIVFPLLFYIWFRTLVAVLKRKRGQD